MNTEHLQWWNNLRHGGMLLDTQRLSNLVTELPEKPDGYLQDRFRREIITFKDNPDEKRSSFIVSYAKTNLNLKISNLTDHL